MEINQKPLRDTQSRHDNEAVFVIMERGSGCMKTLKIQDQSLTMGFGHSEAGVIRPCTERQKQSPCVNIQDLLKYKSYPNNNV